MKHIVLTTLVIFVLIMTPGDGFGAINLGLEEYVEAGGVDISVPGYSVPSFVDWNNDGLKDLVIGQGSGTQPVKVRVYLNVGTQSNPQFSGYFYAQSLGADLTTTGSGCMGCFPRVVYWDSDARKDLLVGEATGYVKIFLNIGTDESPTFDGGTRLQVGTAGSKTTIDVGDRACSSAVDWNSDGSKDLVVGALDGKIHIFINEGTDTEPDFIAQTYAYNYSNQLVVPSGRSSPDVLDLDNDDMKDIISGNTNGQLVFYSNTGTDEDPSFSGQSYVRSDGSSIDLPSTPRSRPYVCYWTDDVYFDVLIGAGDGKVHLYQGIPQGDLDSDGDVDFYDFAEFAQYWQQTYCGYCGGADLTDDESVDCNDLEKFVEHWLEGVE